MLDDLRHLPPQDSFALMNPDTAVLLIVALGVFVTLFIPYY